MPFVYSQVRFDHSDAIDKEHHKSAKRGYDRTALLGFAKQALEDGLITIEVLEDDSDTVDHYQYKGFVLTKSERGGIVEAIRQLAFYAPEDVVKRVLEELNTLYGI